MAQGPSDTILVAIRITLGIRESKVRNPDPPDRQRFVLSEHSFLVCILLVTCKWHIFCPTLATHVNDATRPAIYFFTCLCSYYSWCDISEPVGELAELNAFAAAEHVPPGAS